MTRLALPIVLIIGLFVGYGFSRVVVGPDCTVAPQLIGRAYHGPAIVCPTPGLLWY